MPILLLLFLLIAQQPQPSSEPLPEPGTIEGTVVQSDSGAPVRRAHVFLTAPTKGEIFTLTDESGKYVFRQVNPGEVSLRAHHPRFQDGALDKSVLVESGKVARAPALRLSPLCVVAGRVVDEDGAPMVNVQVTVSDPKSKQQKADTTDDRGEYRIWGITPGKAIVKAAPDAREGLALSSEPTARAFSSYVTLYYPASEQVSGATVMNLAPGAELLGIDFKMRRVSATTVSGKVIGPEGVVWMGVLRLVPEGKSEEPSSQAVVVSAKPQFTLSGVRPGDYNLQAFGMSDGRRLYGSIPLSVGREPVKGVQVTIAGLSKVIGRVTAEGGDPLDAGELTLFLSSGEERANPSTATVKKDGSFEFTDVMPGKKMSLTTISPWFVKDVRTGQGALADQEITVAPASELRLEVVVSNRVATIRCRVMDGQGQPVSEGVMVKAYPTRRPSDNLYGYSGGAMDDGEFQIPGLPPGEYRLIALRFANEILEEPDRVKNLALSDGKLIQVAEGGEHRVELKISALEKEKR